MLHFYTTDNVTQNQGAYNTFIESFMPLLASIPCPKCGMVGLLILYGTQPRYFINEDMIRIRIMIQRVRCNNCGSTHVVLPTTVLPYFLHIILNIQNALNSDTEMNITYRDYLKRRFKFASLEPFPVFIRFFSTIHSFIKNRIKKPIYFGFFILPTHLRKSFILYIPILKSDKNILEVKRSMNDSYDNIITICNTFGLEMDRIESCTSIVRNKQLFIDLKLTDKRPPCPECGNESVKIKGYVAKKINHSILSDKGCILVYHARRFICPICHTTYYEFNPFVFKRMKITSNVIQCVMRDLTKPSETFVSIAERYHISPTTVASIFDATVNIPRAKLPRIMSTDENYAFYSKDTHSKYVCVLIDQQTGRPIDILPSRRYDYLDEYYSKIPKYEKEYLPKYGIYKNR